MSSKTSLGKPPGPWLGSGGERRRRAERGKTAREEEPPGPCCCREPNPDLPPDMMPNRALRKAVSRDAAPRSEPEGVTEYAVQLRKIGDKWDLRQRILNLISKLFCPGT